MVDKDGKTRIRLPNYLVGTDLGALQEDTLVNSDEFGQVEALEDAVSDLQMHHKDLTDRVQDNEKSYTTFVQQFMPGRTYVQSLIYSLVYEATLTVPSAVQSVYPGGTIGTNPPTGTGFDISQDLQHAFYEISAYTLDQDPISSTGLDVLYQGGAFTIAARTVTLGIMRNYKTGPPRLETFLTVYQASGADIDLHVKIYRKIGLV